MEIKPEEFRQIALLLKERSGIAIGANKTYLVENRLSCLLPEYQCDSFMTLYHKAVNNTPGLTEKIIDLMTTNETLWFRDMRPYTIFSEKLLPAYCNELRSRALDKIRIWSAACSTGQEPYSLAMIILDQLAFSSIKPVTFEIIATDISSTCLNIAKKGQYDSVTINRGLPKDFQNRYFVKNGNYWQIADKVREMVTFKKFNLQDSFYHLGKFDLILCRNVAIYFNREFKVELFAKFYNALESNGFLFLGASESLTGYSDRFEILQYKQGYYYQTVKNQEKTNENSLCR